ncbi:MAG: DUF4249 family protein [Candidatus Kapabacteria bacterium]|nr:DUF4249 family protein [Candidatus Kapabacteria bacterium]
MKNILFSSIIVLLLYSCGEETVINATFPFVEKIIIRGVLNQGDDSVSIKVYKTLPPLENYSPERAIIKDAFVTIDHDGVIDTLKYTGYNFTYSSKKLAVIANKTYNLSVNWNGKFATASTLIPPKVDLGKLKISYTLDSNMYRKQFILNHNYFIKSDPNFVYLYGYTNIQSPAVEYDKFYIDTCLRDLDSDPANSLLRLNVYSPEVIDTVTPPQLYNDYFAFVEIYDYQYYPYYLTAANANKELSLFSSGSSIVGWNIIGEGIGLFIGRSYSYKKIVY